MPIDKKSLWSLAVSISAWAGSQTFAAAGIDIQTLSTRPDRVSGGDALVRVALPRMESIAVTLNGKAVTSAFRPVADTSSYIGLLRGLELGANKLEVEAAGREHASLQLTNHPIQGPIVSGPHLQPFICQTADFVLPDGSKWGPAQGPDCSAATRVDYVYMPKDGEAFKALPNPNSLPADVAKTTTTAGATVNFVVRVETATINRGIYQSAILHDSTADPVPSPFSPPAGWNKLLIGIHGSGCTGGWYTQGGTQTGLASLRNALLDAHRLGQGYALFLNTLQNSSNSCNAFLAGETAMMGKEHFIETYGVPRYSLSIGGSGGAYTGLQIIDAFPGVFDGALIDSTFPDALSIALSAMDGHLLTHYFTATKPVGFTEAQQVAVSGYRGREAWYHAANQAARTDPVPSRKDVEKYTSAVWNPIVPESLRYDPKTQPRGARPTVWDVTQNIYGTDPATGFALRVFDNVGVQYGLSALNTGAISKTQFLDLNQGIGGYDRDDNYVRGRTVADQHALVEAYRSGLQLSGHGGLAGVPIVDLSGIMNEAGNYHYQWFHFAVRERLSRANGDSGNHVMWRGNFDSGPDADKSIREQAFDYLNQWIAAALADESQLSQHEKVVSHKPSVLTDGCWTQEKPYRFIAEAQTFGSQPSTRCNALWPSYAFPRFVAGGPLAANALKCQLKSVDLREYRVAFTPAEKQRLRSIFPQGVCDWARPGVAFRNVELGVSYGP